MAQVSDTDQVRKEKMAKILIDIGAVGARPEEPFTFTSGDRKSVV